MDGDGGGHLAIGLVAAEGMPHRLADDIARDLPGRLRERLGEDGWEVEVREAEPAEPTAGVDDLVESLRDRMLREGWQLAVGLTDLPLEDHGRPVAAHASATHGVALLSVPALGAVNVESRAEDVVLNLVEGLLGESVDEPSEAGDDGRRERMTRRLGELRAGPRAVGAGTVAFTSATLFGNLRLLVGMVRANEPSRVITRLSRALAAALGTAAYAISSSSAWLIAAGASFPRLLGLGVGAVVLTCVALIAAHGLWEGAPSAHARAPVVLFNLATSITLLLAVLTLYLGLFAAALAAGVALIPPDVFKGSVGHPAELAEFVRLAWLGATIATLASALGSLLESHAAVREAAYRRHSDGRTESGSG